MRLKCLSALIPALALCACNSVTDLAGHYEGNQIARAGTRLEQRLVRAEVTTQGHHVTIDVSDVQGAKLEKIEVEGLSESHLKLMLPGLADTAIDLSLSKGCYEGKSGESHFVACYNEENFVLEVTGKDEVALFSLTLDKFDGQPKLVYEPSKAFTLTDVVNQGMQRNFDTRIEFQHVMQARHTKRNAYLNLLPHVGVNTGAAIWVMDMAGLIGSIGDLVPFLLPSRWLAAKATALRSHAEEQAMILMQMDTGLQVEGMAYALHHDQKVLKLYHSTAATAQELLDELNSHEGLGQLPPGTSTDMKSIVNSIQQDSLALELSVKESKGLISQTVGFYNPDAISEIAIDDNLAALDGAKKLSADDLVQTAIDRSFELKQIAFLIQAAEKTVTERYFDWLDPAVDPTLELGFGLGQAVQVAKSQLRELLIKQDQVRSLLIQKVTNAVTERNQALSSYFLAKQGMDIQSERLNRMLELVRFGVNYDMFGLVAVFQDYLRAGVSLENSAAAFRISGAKLDRFLLQGFYSGVLRSAKTPTCDQDDCLWKK